MSKFNSSTNRQNKMRQKDGESATQIFKQNKKIETRVTKQKRGKRNSPNIDRKLTEDMTNHD